MARANSLVAIDSARLVGVTPTEAGLALLDDASAAAQRATLGLGQTFAAYATGSGYALTGTSALVDFATTDPTITITQPGTYLLFASAVIAPDGIAHAYNVTLRYRRTNNTPANLTSGSVVILDIPSAAIASFQIVLPVLVYTTSNNDDVLSIFGNVTGDTGAEVSACNIVAVRIV